MKTQLFKKTLLLAILFSCINCTKNNTIEPVEEDQLPPITQTGKNTFGCLIDGEVFIPKDKKGYTPPGGGTPRGLSIQIHSFLPSYEYFTIRAKNYNDIYIYIYIPKEVPEELPYTFKLSPGLTESSIEPNYPHSFMLKYTSKYLTYQNSGSITFTKIDFVAKVYSGVFSYKVKNGNDIIEITEGRFDFNLNTLNN